MQVAEWQPAKGRFLYYTNDPIRSVRLVTDPSGKVVWSAAYAPFGRMEKVWAREYNSPLKYSGKERDGLLGLDYFGARYYAFGMYRFNSTDPVIDMAAAVENPQLWNRYAYCRNNPVTVTDPDGRWSEENHDAAIREGLKGSVLTPEQIELVVQFNNEFDVDSQDRQYLHAMRDEGQSVEEAQRKALDFAAQKLLEIRESRSERMARGYKRVWTRSELRKFAQMQHIYVDETCPGHAWKEWHGYTSPSVVTHAIQDRSVTPQQRRQNAGIVRKLFDMSSK